MKKALIIIVMLFAASGITVKAQTEKGNFFIAGSNRLELNIGGEKQKVDGDLVEGSEYSYFDFDFQPSVGYFFFDNFTGGLFMDIDMYSNKSKDEEYGYTYKGTTFIVGPFVRYYIPVCDKLIPYAHLAVGVGVDNYRTKYNSDDEWTKTNESVFSYRIGGGATYFFNEFVGADAFIGFNHESYKYKAAEPESRSSDSNSKYIYNELLIQLGVVVMLHK
jgi:hypothetical protein